MLIIIIIMSIELLVYNYMIFIIIKFIANKIIKILISSLLS